MREHTEYCLCRHRTGESCADWTVRTPGGSIPLSPPARHDDTAWALPAKEPVWKGSVGQIRSASEVMATASEHGRRQAEAQERIADTLGRIQGILRDMLIELHERRGT